VRTRPDHYHHHHHHQLTSGARTHTVCRSGGAGRRS
jgi:hypothetical protein